MGDLKNDDIFADKRCCPGTGINALVDVEADPRSLIVELGQPKMCFQWMVGRRQESIVPGLLNRDNVVFGNPAVLEQTRKDDIFRLLDIVL